VYVFQVLGTGNKKSIAQAITAQYKVTPVKVSIVRIPAKETFVRGKRGMKAGYKKAYIYLKKGDKIEII
jgi:ribosomal protein L23